MLPNRFIWSAVLALLLAPGVGAAEAQPRQSNRDADCTVCHGELELLRQNVPHLARARELLVLPAHIRGSAHDGMACAECHTGFGAYPHPQAARTTTCGNCHEDAQTEWGRGQHARENVGGETAAPCASCHGVHEMAPVAALAEGQPMRVINARCTACHQADALPADDPHTNQVGCWTCHGAHLVHAKDDPASLVAPLLQASTCGACHEDAARNWRRDVHGSSTLAAFGGHPSALALPIARETPVCTACHGAHGMLASEAPGFLNASVAMCQGCHEYETRTFFDSYHGKATALGSRVSAGCHHCHGSHGVFSQDDERSMVHAGNLIETCQECHPHARPAFVTYDAHPDPFNFERNPWIFGAFWMMNLLLAGVMAVFGTHTVLWWVRLYIDKRRGILHGPHHHRRHPHDGADDAHGTEGKAEP
jgi:predicted CXXCH cytochrome family protein